MPVTRNVSAIEAWVVHPNMSDVKVRVRRLRKLEQMAYFGRLAKYQRAVPLTDANGAPLRNKKGEVEVHVFNDMPLEAITEMLELVVTGWDIKYDDGTAVPFNKADYAILFEDELICKVPNEKAGEKIIGEDGEEVGVEPELREMPFWQYISEQVNSGRIFRP